MKIFITDHARQRMKQRGVTLLELSHVLRFPLTIRNSHDGKKIAVGIVNNRNIHIVFFPRENYIKIITVM